MVCTHGRFGEELLKSAAMIIGEVKDVKAFSLLPGMDPFEYRSMLEEELENHDEENVLCMVDLFGGTPCNMAASLLKRNNLEVVSGLNLAMLIEVATQRETQTLEELTKTALNTLGSSGFDVGARLRTAHAEKGEEKDG